MTYIKPESSLNQLSWVKEIIAQGTQAAQEQNWVELSDRLRLLPLSNDTSQKLWLLDDRDWQSLYDLALKMLIQADFQHKWEITKLFPLFGAKIIVPFGDLLLDNTIEPEVRWFVCQILGNFPNREVVLILVKLLQQDSDSELTAIASKTLIKIGDRSIDALIDLLPDPKYRLLAAQSLSYIRTAETITPLLKVVQDRDPVLRTIAVNALSSFHDRRVPLVLLDALQDKASSVRKSAAIALGFRPDLNQELSLVTHLQPLLRDLNLEVCCHTAVSLGRMQQRTANQALFEVLQADNTPIMLKSEIIKALAWSEINSSIDYLQQALTTANEFITQEIITVLGRVSPSELKPQSAKVLIHFWQYNHQLCSPTTRQILAASLGELSDRSGQGVLEELATDSDRKVKLHALAALKKLSLDK